jgi:hypothetical protein
VNNLITRVNGVAFGFRRFRNYRVRALLYAGKPNWDLLATTIASRFAGLEPAVRPATSQREQT